MAVSRAKQKLSLYTADSTELFKRAERSAAKENPSDYLPLFRLVESDAENEKAPAPARVIHRRDQAESIGDRVGAGVESSHQAAVPKIGQLRQEVSHLRQQQSILVEALEQMQRNHTEQLKMLADNLRQSLADDSSE